jgi:hypothetical protein
MHDLEMFLITKWFRWQAFNSVQLKMLDGI